MDTLRIRLICDFSTTEHWPFTRFVQELKLTGVHTFRLNIMNGDMEFLDDRGGGVYETRPGRRVRVVSHTIDGPRLTLEFRRFLDSNTTLPDMVSVLAGAGVQFFEVDLAEGSCSFYGHAVQVTGHGEFGQPEEPASSAASGTPRPPRNTGDPAREAGSGTTLETSR